MAIEGRTPVQLRTMCRGIPANELRLMLSGLRLDTKHLANSRDFREAIKYALNYKKSKTTINPTRQG